MRVEGISTLASVTARSIRLLAVMATTTGLLLGGFEAHLAPQAEGWWHGLTGSPSEIRIAASVAGGLLVFVLGGILSVRPFLWMGLGLLPLVPATTGFGAPLLLFSGFTMVLVFAILLGLASSSLLPRLPALHPATVSALAFAFFLLVGRALPGPAGPQGDEPHYLLIAESLLQDGDVDLKNQFEDRAFSKFTVANLEPHTAPRSPKGHLYAIHTPGLAALIAPGYAMGGFTGARATVSGLLALSVGLLFVAARTVFGGPTAAFVALLATFASPLPVYANSLYPDSVAALPVAATLASLALSHRGLWALATATLALLPWLHPRFLPLAFVLAAALAARGESLPAFERKASRKGDERGIPPGLLRSGARMFPIFGPFDSSPAGRIARGPRPGCRALGAAADSHHRLPGLLRPWSAIRIGTAFLPLLLSLLGLLFHFHRLFGNASISAAYGPGFSSDVSLLKIPWGASALLLDRQFGLLLFSPVLLLGLGGLPHLWRQNRALTLTTLGGIGALLGVGGAFSMWWGGASPPARFTIGATPALLLLCGALWKSGETRTGVRRILGASAGYGMGLLWVAILAPRALHNRADGASGLLRLLAPTLDLDRFFPGFVTEDLSVLVAVSWVAVIVASVTRPGTALMLLALPLSAGSLGAAGPLIDPFTASLRALESWSFDRRTFGGRDTPAAFVLDVPLGAPPWDLWPGQERYSPRFSLPRGEWTIRVSARALPTQDAVNVARVSIVGDDATASPLVSSMVRVGEGVSEASFSTARYERRLHVRGEGLQAQASILSIHLTPESLSDLR